MRSGCTTAPIKVFILAGDECVLEQGVVVPLKQETAEAGPGTLPAVIATEPEYAFLKDRNGQ